MRERGNDFTYNSTGQSNICLHASPEIMMLPYFARNWCIYALPQALCSGTQGGRDRPGGQAGDNKSGSNQSCFWGPSRSSNPNAKRALETDFNHHFIVATRSSTPHPISCGTHDPCGCLFTTVPRLSKPRSFKPLSNKTVLLPPPPYPRHARSPFRILRFAATHNGRPRAGADSLRCRFGANLQTPKTISGAPRPIDSVCYVQMDRHWRGAPALFCPYFVCARLVHRCVSHPSACRCATSTTLCVILTRSWCSGLRSRYISA